MPWVARSLGHAQDTASGTAAVPFPAARTRLLLLLRCCGAMLWTAGCCMLWTLDSGEDLI
jgi:hypothetical protein